MPAIIMSDLALCLRGGLPVLMVGDVNSKHVDWNFRLIILRNNLLRELADRVLLDLWAGFTHHCPVQSFCHPDVLGIVLTKDSHTPVHLTACSALSSDHLPVLIDTGSRSSFLNLPDFRRTDWSKFEAYVHSDNTFNPESADEANIDTCVGNLSSPMEVSAPKGRPRADPLVFMKKYAWSNSSGGSDKSQGTLLWTLR